MWGVFFFSSFLVPFFFFVRNCKFSSYVIHVLHEYLHSVYEFRTFIIQLSVIIEMELNFSIPSRSFSVHLPNELFISNYSPLVKHKIETYFDKNLRALRYRCSSWYVLRWNFRNTEINPIQWIIARYWGYKNGYTIRYLLHFFDTRLLHTANTAPYLAL